MIKKFVRYEEAALFVEQKKAEGFHAYIMNEATGFLWGPRTVGGFRVFVSDEPFPEGDIPPPLDEQDDTVSKVIRFLVLSVVAVGTASGLYFVLRELPTFLALLGTLAIVLIAGYFIFNRDMSHPPS